MSFFLFSFVSCVSDKVIPIPGEEGKIINNIYVEYYDIAETYYNLQNYSKAIDYYERAMSNKKLYWSSYFKLAKCYVLSSNWNKALPMYKKILSRDPDNSTLKASLAYIYIMQGDLKSAKNIYEELLQLEPNNQSYIENYVAILMVDEENYKANLEKITELMTLLRTQYPDNSNTKKLEETIKKFEEKELQKENSGENPKEIAEVESSEKTEKEESKDKS